MITLSQTGGTSGITTITISATSRSEMSDFVKKYTLANQTKSMLMAVTQKGYVPSGKYISFKPSSFNFNSSGGTGSLQVTSNDDWYINFGSWVYPNEVRGNGNTIVGIRVEANTGNTRTDNITGYCLSDSAQTASTSVSQVGSYVEPTLSVSPLKTAVNASGGTGFTLAVTSNQDWITYADARWVTMNTLSGSGDGSISFEVGENATDIVRESNIYVVSTASSLSAVSVVAQSAQTQEEPYIIVSPTTKRIGTSGGSFTVTVSSNTEWETAVVYSGQERAWIALDKLNGYGDDTVVVRVEPYFDESETGRTAYISFYNNSEGLKVDVNIEEIDFVDNTKIFYTTDTGEAILIASSGWNENIISNVYEGEYGVITFDGDVTKIANNGFRQSSQSMYLTSIEIPSSVTVIGNNAFQNCSKLYYINIPNNVTTIGQSSFSNTQLSGVTIGSGLTEIPQQAFYHCTNMAYIEIPSNVLNIGNYAFDGCSYLTGATIHSNIIGGYSFYNCGRLSVLNFGSEVQEIGMNAFYHCTGLTEMYSFATTEPQIVTGIDRPTFNGVSATGTLHYPIGSNYSTWISALPSGWTAVADL